MAIYFELVVNFGDNVEAAQAAALTDPRPFVLRAGTHRIPLHRPILRTDESCIELTILPVAVGFGVVADGSLPRIRLTTAELTELGHQLYALLAKFDGYIAAKVGWDPESFLDPGDLKSDWTPDELSDGSIHGLVLSEQLHAELGLGDDYVIFQPGYRWIPYRGEKPGSLSAD
ncbi:hypothetical protein ACH4TP_32835 [Streptomyces sp. NPDC021012]|uniref:hypothetical protein n=1 Tax=Streptomyces sp. NPDC021012 TaxID=3365107 RepID=UPI003787896D